MTVLVTNDDGIDSPGLHALARALADAGHELLVVAPDRDMSGSAAALGQLHVDEGIDAQAVELPGLPGVPSFAVDGPPGLCVLAARLGGFGEAPRVVVSGINPGCNTGRAILHSGTVGAALTAANFGCRGLAVSLDVSTRVLHEQAGRGAVVEDRAADAADGKGGDDGVGAPARWDTAAGVGAAALRWLLEAPDRTVLNVNVPNLAPDALAGVRPARLAPFGTVRSTVVEPASDGGRLQVELRPSGEQMPPDSDTGLVALGFVAVTPIAGPRADDGVDVSGLLDTLAVEARSTA